VQNNFFPGVLLKFCCIFHVTDWQTKIQLMDRRMTTDIIWAFDLTLCLKDGPLETSYTLEREHSKSQALEY
jgi:hypothetical protein